MKRPTQQLERQVADQKSQLQAMMLRGAPTPTLEDALATMYRSLQKLQQADRRSVQRG
jgi:hypothetical protein